MVRCIGAVSVPRDLSHGCGLCDGGTQFVRASRRQRQKHQSDGIAQRDHRWLFHAAGGAAGSLCDGAFDSGESEAMFGELGNMQPSRSSLDRLPKALLPHWKAQRVTWEAQLRQTETVPTAAQVLALSVDGVMAPMRGAENKRKPSYPASTPAGRRVTRKSAAARLLCTTGKPNAYKPCAMRGCRSTKR